MKWRNMTYAQRKKKLEIEAGTPYLYCPDCDVKIGLNTVFCLSCGCGNPSELAMKDRKDQQDHDELEAKELGITVEEYIDKKIEELNSLRKKNLERRKKNERRNNWNFRKGSEWRENLETSFGCLLIVGIIFAVIIFLFS